MAEALGIASSVIAVIDLSAKVASWCSEYYANVKNAPDDIKRLQGETQRLSETLEEVQSLCNGPNSAKLQASQSLRDGIMECKKQLARLESKLTPGTKQKVMKHFGAHALKWPFKTKEVDSIMKKLKSCKDSISFNLQVDQTIEVNDITYRVKILTIHQEIVFNKLKSVNDAAFDSYAEEHNARCYQGTRIQLLQQIDTWASDLSSECIFWLNGMAGTGKSTISRTVAQNLSAKGELGASFFFKRGEGDRGHSGLLFATIATQLVQILPSLAPHVQYAIEADPAISTKTLKQQFDGLILEPISKLPRDPQKLLRVVIVIDALDECDREEDIRIIIRLLSQVKSITSVYLKFFLTSRPELPIRLGFKDIHGRYEDLALHQIPKAVVQEDISAFLEHELTMIRDDYNKSVNPSRRLPADWPGESILQSLVGMAIPLFIFATTICRFINDRKCGQPKDQLAKVLRYETKSQVSKLDATYLPVLEQLLVGVSPSDKRDIVAEFQQVVGSIIVLARPLSATSLDLLLGLSEGTADNKVDLLHSVLSIPSDPNLPIRLLHLSFRDFLVDTEKRETNPFWVDEKEAHKKLASRCLLCLTTSGYLKKDICDLRVPERPQADIDQHTIDTHLPPDVQYACQYWVYHLKECGNVICDNDQVYNFLECHFLHWLEALSLMGRISESISMINDLITIADLRADIKVSTFLYDAKRFILMYLSIAESSPLQLYSAALVFSPKDSIIRNLYQNYVPNWIPLQPEVESDWNNVLQTLEGHSRPVHSVNFSHDSILLASVSEDKTIKVWDTATGSLQQTLEGHSRPVYSVAFSHNSTLLASASVDETIKVWDTATGSLQQILDRHSGLVCSVALSHDSTLLVSASEDKTIKVWDMATGLLQQTIKVNNYISSLAFDSIYSSLITNIGRIRASADHGLHGTQGIYCGYHLTTELIVLIFHYRVRQSLSDVNLGR
ncbi:Vegetative incompatibility HET-E-1 protein [Rutstroemia sp. NJR-2017a BBW]|nr:Vegetative incompatibility HET-E-1 protein [Rutstroemia sp. NJR-2017a BBW]